MSEIIYANGEATVTVPALDSIAVYTKGTARVYREVGYPNVPATKDLIGTVTNTQTVFGAYASGATIIIEAGAADVEYVSGVGPVTDTYLGMVVQGTPGVLNATGALTAAMMVARIVTSTAAAAVAATVPTGTVLDAATSLEIDDSFDWTVIVTGANAFTVTAATAHTLVGSGVVAANTSCLFRSRKTAANTFVTYRLGQ
jgi:hypothetical protein